MEPKGSFLHLQEPSASPCAEPARSSPCLHVQLPEDVLISSSHLHLGLPSGLFPVCPPKPCICLFFPPIRATCPFHLILLNFITRTLFGEEYRSLSSSYVVFSTPVTSSLSGPNILLNTLSLCSSLNVSDQVSHPYKTGKIIDLYTIIFKFLESRLEDKRFCTE